MAQILNINYKQIVVIALTAITLALALVLLRPDKSQAQTTCTNLPSTFGLATHSEPSVAAGSYNVWSRVKISTGTATYRLSIDGGAAYCNQPVSKDSNGSWVWTKQATKLTWAGGNMRIQMSGDKAGVGLDCIVLHTDDSFNPTTKEDCNPQPTPPPPTDPLCVASDVNKDGRVDFFGDVVPVFGSRGSIDPIAISKYDVDKSGAIRLTDAVIVNDKQGCL